MSCIICYNDGDIYCSNCHNPFCLDCLKEMSKQSFYKNRCPYCTLKFGISILMKIDPKYVEEFINSKLCEDDRKLIASMKTVRTLITKIENSYTCARKFNTYSVICCKLMMLQLNGEPCEKFITFGTSDNKHLVKYISSGETPPLYISDVSDVGKLKDALLRGQQELFSLSDKTFFMLYNLVNAGKRRVTYKNLKAPNVMIRLKDMSTDTLKPLLNEMLNDICKITPHVYLRYTSVAWYCRKCFHSRLDLDFKCLKCKTQHCSRCGLTINSDSHTCANYDAGYFETYIKTHMNCYVCGYHTLSDDKRYYCCHCKKAFLIYEYYVIETEPIWEELLRLRNPYECMHNLAVKDISPAFNKLIYNEELTELVMLCKDLIIISKICLKDYIYDDFIENKDMTENVLSFIISQQIVKPVEEFLSSLLAIQDRISFQKLKEIFASLESMLKAINKEEECIDIKKTKIWARIHNRISKFIESKTLRKGLCKSETIQAYL